MGRDIRYCTTDDGVRIAYCVEGTGPPLFLLNYFLESISEDDTAEWAKFRERLSAGRQVVRYDPRGSGLSQREGIDISFPGLVRDTEAVVAAAGLEMFDLCGMLLSGVLAIEFAARHPAAVRRLVLYSSFACADEAMPLDGRMAIAALCRTNWAVASQTIVDLALRQESTEVGIEVASSVRRRLNGDVMAKVFEFEVDLTDRLPAVEATTLVLQRIGDTTIPFEAGQKLASAIPNARLVPLAAGSVYPGAGDWQELSEAIVAFLREGEAPQAPAVEQGAFRAILFTDIVDHTLMMQRLGDDRGRTVLREHDTIMRELLNEHLGQEIKAMGDGFMAAFASATKAVECAIALQRRFTERAETAEELIVIRVGLNAGEPVAEDDDLFGASVILAARIAAYAGPGEILVSEGVRQVVAGKQFLLADRGMTALRGFEDPVRVYAVNWSA